MQLIEYFNKGLDTRSKLAVKIGVTAAQVSHWLTGFRPLPLERALVIERETKGQVTCESLRPDIDWRRWSDIDVKAKG